MDNQKNLHQQTLKKKPLAIQLKKEKINDSLFFDYYLDPPLVNGYQDAVVTQLSKQSHFISIRFFPSGNTGMLMSVFLLDELGKMKDHLSFEHYEHLLKGYDPQSLDPAPFLKAIGYANVYTKFI